MGRYSLLRRYCTTLLAAEKHDEILQSCTKKKKHSLRDTEHILTRMSLRKLLRTQEQSTEDVWTVYACRQAERFRTHLVLQSRPRYMNHLYTGTSNPFPDIRPKKIAFEKARVKKKSAAPVETWTNLSEADILARKKNVEEKRERERDVRREFTLKETSENSVCYTCTAVVQKEGGWKVAHLVYPVAEEALCNEKYNLRIVCQSCHDAIRGRAVHEYVLREGAYRCGKSLAAKEYVSSLGRAVAVYYEMYSGSVHED